ncbi:MAG TPA: AEC family transporter [Anaeromyxobacteraceae bacterium]|nr:AEC family transporter [Anaeromyxobacteraceae bacterium]
MLQRIVQIILPVFAIVAAGWLYGRRHRPDTAAVNRMNMDIFVPALVLSALTSRDFDLWQNRALILGSLGVVLGSGLLAWPLARWLEVDARTFVPPMMFNNCGNMGLPLALLAFGEKWLPAAVALFVTSNLLHFTLGARMVRRDARLWGLLRSPMVLATAAGALLSALAWRPPEWVALPLRMVGDVAVPLMLFALGVRMTGISLEGWRLGVAGAAVRPLAGLVVALPLGPLLGLTGTPLAMLYLFASLPPAVLNFLVAEQYRQEPEKVASIVLIGNLASLVFVPLGLWLGLRVLG